jgi:hypothetical protein
MMNRIENSFKAVLHIFLLTSIFSCNSPLKKPDKIDRFALVTRHNVFNDELDSLSSLSVGNGEFAVTVDATGLQTVPEIYEKGVCPQVGADLESRRLSLLQLVSEVQKTYKIQDLTPCS